MTVHFVHNATMLNNDWSCHRLVGYVAGIQGLEKQPTNSIHIAVDTSFYP